jgi:hypothetical protein
MWSRSLRATLGALNAPRVALRDRDSHTRRSNLSGLKVGHISGAIDPRK